MKKSNIILKSFVWVKLCWFLLLFFIFLISGEHFCGKIENFERVNHMRSDC
uniref:Uncharacterized protein n=1 Tax=Rhizophora mucronata TaxID=61149 RepID=A0A2P2PXK9_RHIMU